MQERNGFFCVLKSLHEELKTKSVVNPMLIYWEIVTKGNLGNFRIGGQNDAHELSWQL